MFVFVAGMENRIYKEENRIYNRIKTGNRFIKDLVNQGKDFGFLF